MTLAGKTILITRAPHQAEEFVQKITQSGGIPFVFPTIEIAPPQSWEACDRALDSLYMYDGLIFTSTNGVDFFWRRLTERGIAFEELHSKIMYAVGEKTKQAIENHGCNVTIVPEKFTALDLGRTLQQEDLHGKCFLFPRGSLGNTFLADSLKLLHAQVDQVIVYQTLRPKQENIDQLRVKLLSGGIDVATFTSPSTVKNFAALFTPAEFNEIKQRTTIAVIGPVTAAAAEKIGLAVDIEAEQSSVDSLMQALLKYFQSDIHTKRSESVR